MKRSLQRHAAKRRLRRVQQECRLRKVYQDIARSLNARRSAGSAG